MLRRLPACVFALAAVLLTSSLRAADPDAKPATPAVEVAFVLDTTGSMSGLIEGAKQKIWSIANQVTRPEGDGPRPRVKIALVGYRDRGDAYVTQVHDLSDDLDAVFGHLSAFKADGGGDGPESVNQALHEAVTKLSWSTDRDTLKVVFLVGDAPPHMDYEQDVKYPDTCKQAVAKDLIINTIQCGGDTTTTPIWRQIAELGEGRFAQIGQTGDMTVAATPVDGELAELNRAMAATVVPYGAAAQQREVVGKVAAATAAPAAPAADRMKYMKEAEAGSAISGAGDLVTDAAAGKVKLDELKDAELPAALQGKNAEERAAYVEQQAQRRAELQVKIDDLLKQRQAHLDAQRAEQAKAGKGDAFDEQVAAMLAEQAAAKQAE